MEPISYQEDSPLGPLLLFLAVPLILLVLVILLAFTPLQAIGRTLMGRALPDDSGLAIYDVTCRPVRGGYNLYMVYTTQDSTGDLHLSFEGGGDDLFPIEQSGLHTVDILLRSVEACPATITLTHRPSGRKSGASVEIFDS